MTEEKKKNEVLLALAILLGHLSKQQIDKIEEFKDLPEQALKIALAEFAKNKDLLEELLERDDFTQVDIQKEMADIGKAYGHKVFIIANPGDGKTCENCRQWIGKRVSDTDPNFPSVNDWINSGGLHPNCRCSLHAVDEVKDSNLKAADYLARKQARLAELAAYNAFNTEPLTTFIFN